MAVGDLFLLIVGILYPQIRVDEKWKGSRDVRNHIASLKADFMRFEAALDEAKARMDRTGGQAAPGIEVFATLERIVESWEKFQPVAHEYDRLIAAERRWKGIGYFAAGIGGATSLLGFVFWVRRVQRPQDHLLQAQLMKESSSSA